MFLENGDAVPEPVVFLHSYCIINAGSICHPLKKFPFTCTCTTILHTVVYIVLYNGIRMTSKIPCPVLITLSSPERIAT